MRPNLFEQPPIEIIFSTNPWFEIVYPTLKSKPKIKKYSDFGEINKTF